MATETPSLPSDTDEDDADYSSYEDYSSSDGGDGDPLSPSSSSSDDVVEIPPPISQPATAAAADDPDLPRTPSMSSSLYEDEEEAKAAAGPSRSGCLAEVDAAMGLNCPICYEPWTPEGPHRVCCTPCGHVYGRSCLEKWVRKCGNGSGKCPTCKRRIKLREIVNLYAPLIAVRNDDLEKEVRTLREKNEQLQLEKANLVEEASIYKKHPLDREYSDRPKMACIEHTSPGGSQRIFRYCDEKLSSSEAFLENSIRSPNYSSSRSHYCSLVLQNEMVVEGARVMAIDAYSQILLVSGKRPGVLGEHVLNKISLLASYGIHKIMLPTNTGAIKDMCTLPNGLALLASLGKKLSLFSMGSNNLVLKYDLPGPAWSCSRDCNSQYHIYAGLQNGTLLVFDIRQTATHLESIEGLSRYPIHTVHSLPSEDSTKKVLTASSLGPCVWDVSGSGVRPFLVPEMVNHGVCIALACSSSTDDIVASFRPKVELHSNNVLPFQFPVSASNPVSGSSRMGSHVLIKRMNGMSFHKQEVASGSVSEVRMSKSVIISSEGNSPLFAYGDESTHGLCLWDLPSLHMYKRLKPHQYPILDVKYAHSAGPGLLGSISENKLQVFTCF